MLRDRFLSGCAEHRLLMVDRIDSRRLADSAALRLELLGSPCLRLPDNNTIALARKDAALLAILALDGPTAASKLAALLWPDVDDKQAANNLRQRVHRLRKATGLRFIEAGATVQFAGAVPTDLAAALEGIENGPAAGELLGTLNFDDVEELEAWVKSARDRWREQYGEALAAAAARCEKAGELARALQLAQRLVALQPYAEHAHRRVMRLHYLRGDRAAALAALERCRELLQRELNAEPGRETLDLAALIERSGVLAAAPVPPRPVAVLRPPRLVGRQVEWQQLLRAWQGRRIALVIGDPGVGKTRLLADFAAAQGGGVVLAGARPGDGRVAFSALARLLRACLQSLPPPADGWVGEELARVAPELGEPAAGRLEPLRLRQALQAAVENWAGAGLQALVFDDLQFADPATLELLLPLVTPEGPARWLFGVRGNEIPDPVDAWARDSSGDSLLRLDLAPLSLGGTEELLRELALPGFAAEVWAPPLHRHTGGNPLFLLETVGTLAAGGEAPQASGRLPVPASIGQLVESRLTQLSADALKLARVAALAGPDFSAELAAQVIGRHALDLAEPWRELEAAQVIVDNAFAHDLIFEATLRSVPKPIAGLLHRSIAACLESQGAPAARVGLHWAEAGEWSKAAQAFVAAARHARRASSRETEVDYWQRACDSFDRAGQAEAAFDARCESVDSLLLVRGVEQAAGVIEPLLRDARSAAQRVAALTAQATARLLAADFAAGLASARAAYELAANLDSPWPRFEAARLLAVALAQSEDQAAEALPLIEPFRELVEREGSLEQRCKFWADYAYALNSCRRLGATVSALKSAIAVARQLADYGELATLTSNLAQVCANLGQLDAALDYALQSRALRERLGHTGGPASGAIDMYVGWLSGMLGRYRDALEALGSAADCFARDGASLWTAVAANHRAGFLLELGQFARAQQALQYPPPAMDSIRARRALLAGRIERALGRRGEAQAREAAAILGDHGDPYMSMLVQLDVAGLLPAAEAAAACERVRQAAEAIEYRGVAMKARLLHAQHLRRAGEAPAATGALRHVLEEMAGVQAADLYPPEQWRIAHEIFDAAADRRAADAALACGAEWIRRVAAEHVPDEYRDSFLNRNPTNRALLLAAARRDAGAATR
jgi:DNA-binding SARP family transcriptional activator